MGSPGMAPTPLCLGGARLLPQLMSPWLRTQCPMLLSGVGALTALPHVVPPHFIQNGSDPG